MKRRNISLPYFFTLFYLKIISLNSFILSLIGLKSGALIENWLGPPNVNNILIASTTNYSYYTGSTNTSLTLGAKYFTEDYGNTLEPGDKIKFSVKAYTKFGKNYDIGGAVFNNAVTVTESTEYTIQNSGIMRVKANNVWTEGQVWVKVDGNWKEADVVKVKVNGVWEDSE